MASQITQIASALQDVVPVSPVLLYVMLLTGIALTIASILIPYYSGTSGSYGIWTDTNKCLGQPAKSDECNTMEALPIMTILLGFIAIMLLIANHAETSIPLLNQIADYAASTTPFNALISLFNKISTGYTATVVFIGLTALFSIATLVTQLVVPVKPSGSLEDQKNKGTIKYADGMALSAAATAVLATSFLMMMTHVEGYVKPS